MTLEWRWSRKQINQIRVDQGPLTRSWALYVISVALAGGLLLEIPAYLQKWLWMRQVGFLEIFWTLLSIGWGMFFLGFAFAFLFFWINVRRAIRHSFLSQRKFVANEFEGPLDERASQPAQLYARSCLAAVD
jgi:uncharacterized membrane protein (UPF0182 family)